MSRTATAAAQSALAAQAGKDGFVVLKLTLGTQVFWFADRDITQAGLNLDGRIESHGNLDTSVKVDRSGKYVGTIGIMEFNLLDQDKFLLGLLNANDFQGATAEVYHWFVGHVQADMILLLKGRIENAPLWKEDDHTLSFTVETPRRINPIPFAPAESDGLDVDLAHLGQTWPMCFGTPSDVPAVPVKSSPRGTLIQDMTQDGQMDTVGGVATDVPTTTFEIDNPNDDFPQGVECLVKIADEYVTGTFTGNSLHVTQRQVNHYTGISISGNGEIVTLPAGVRAVGQYLIGRDNLSVTTSRPVGEVVGASALAQYSSLIGVPDMLQQNFFGYVYKQIGNQAYIWNGNANFIINNSVADVNRYPNLASAGARWVHKAGSPVVVASVSPVWVCNSIPSTSVVRVRAWRQVTRDDNTGYSRRELVTVPSSLYTTDLSDAAYNNATTLTFDESLDVREAGWESELFATVESTVGSNTSDAIKYLIDSQSEGKLTSDAASFAAVKTLLANYPSNFAIQEQGDVLDICGDIAWQARCGIVWNGSSAQIKYLSKEPTSGVMNLTDVNVLEGAVTIDSTRIEDVITVFSVEWRPNYSDPKPQKLLYRTNVSRYGKREQRYKFWIYQARKCVKKSADFWSARYGRLWRCASANHWGLEGLMADPLDYAGWRISEFLATVYGLVLRSNLAHPATALKVILPIEVGTLVQSSHFWLSDSGDTAPTTRTYSGSARSEAEFVQAPPPEVISITKPEQQVFQVVAVQNEITNPSASDWKTVRVRILTAEEVEARASVDSNNEEIDTIDALDRQSDLNSANAQVTATQAALAAAQAADPQGNHTALQTAVTAAQAAQAIVAVQPAQHNSQLVDDRYDLTTANNDLNSYIQNFVDHSTEVTARDLSATYMRIGDDGTMIKVPGGDYIVTPAGATGPFIVKVSKKPASPAEGTLYADFQGSVRSKVKGVKQIQVLGDGSAIQVGDLMLVFRDGLGNYYTPGGGGTGAVGMAKVITTSGDKDNIPVGIYLTASFNGVADVTTTAKMPSLASPYKVAAGTWAIAAKLGEQWVLQVPLVMPYIP